MEMAEINMDDVKVVEQRPEYSFSGNRILSRVIKQGLWREKDGNGEYLREPAERIGNKDAFLELTREELAKREVDYDTDKALPDAQELTGKARTLLQDGTKKLLDEGIITQDSIDLALKWTRPEDIQVAEDGVGAFNLTAFDVDDTVFPVDEKRPIIIISRKSIVNKINHYKDVLGKVGIEISDENLLAVCLRSIVVHEWAHSLEKAIGVDYYQKVIKDGRYKDDEDGWDGLRSRFKVVWGKAREISDPVLDNSSAGIESEAHGERFASGFEFETTRAALKELNIKPEDVDRFVDYILEDRKKRLSEFGQIRSASGFGDQQLQTICDDINSIARENGNNTVVPVLWAGLGYNLPYSAGQLREMIHGSMDVLQDPEKIYDVLKQEKV